MRPSSSLPCIRRIATISPLLCLLAAIPLAASAQEAQPLAPRVQIVRPSAPSVVTLAPSDPNEQLDANAIDRSGSQTEGTASPARENFRDFNSLHQAPGSDARIVTLRFSSSATLTAIKSTKDLQVQQGGTCVEGGWYAANSTCAVHVRFTPQGAGHRVGRLVVSNSASATPLLVGIGGFGSSPTISFTPSIITTVPQTVSGGVGILAGATNLAIDGGDGLYMADTNNKLVRYLDASGNLQNLQSGFTITDPQGIAVDAADYVYLSQDNPVGLFVLTPFGATYDYPSGSTNCAYGSTCSLGSGPLNSPGSLATDPSGNVFLATSQQANRLVPTNGGFENYIPLADGFNYTYPSAAAEPLAVDASDSIYASYGYNNRCYISSLPYYSAYQGNYVGLVSVAGARGCGFSGDGGQARSALIGTRVTQMVFDTAGNFFFTDTNNQRVRRIDAATGIITTIAGTGSAGYTGDGGPATSAALNTPTGLTVDSQGQVYIISATSSVAEVVRKVGTLGYLVLPGQAVGTPTSAQTVTVANSGNSELDFVHTGFSSGNISDFTIDPFTTTCNFTVPLASGRSCKMGFIFTPTTTGSRTAVYSITSNTIAGVNNIQLNGYGFTTATLTPSSFSFASTYVGSSSSSQTATLTNTGKAVLAISSILISGPAATSFSDTTNCGSTLAIGASCTVAVTFKPTTTGTLSATLTVTDNALGGHQAVTLTGTGLAAAAKATVSPSSLTFASTAIGSTTAAQIMKLSNSGTAALGVSSITISGSQGKDFPFTQNCPSSLAPGASCNISISFKPTVSGARSASVAIVTSTSTINAPVSGTGTAAAVKAATTTRLFTSVNPAPGSRPVLLSAQVSQPASSSPQGKVQLWEGRHMLAQTNLQDGAAHFRLSRLGSGTHALHAVFLGSEGSLNSRSPIIHQIVTGSLSAQ